MNKLLLLTVFISCLNAAAQTNVYHSFPTSSAEWRDIHALCDDPFNLPAHVWDYHYWICGDTVINSLVYHNLCSEYTEDDEYYYNSQLLSSTYFGTYLNGAIREDSLRKIYYYDYSAHSEALMYDFSNLSLGSPLPLTIVNTLYPNGYVSSVDSVLIGNSYRKSYRISDTTSLFIPPAPYLIEGVGFTTGLFYFFPSAPGLRDVLLCYGENQQLQFSQGYTIHHTCGTMLSVNENRDDVVVELIPNPTTGPFTISLLENNNAVIEIYNLQGEIIYSETMKSDKQVFSAKFIPGIIFVKVTTDKNQYVRKLIVE